MEETTAPRPPPNASGACGHIHQHIHAYSYTLIHTYRSYTHSALLAYHACMCTSPYTATVHVRGVGVRSGPGAAWTILLFHIISASPSKQPRMVGSTLGVYSVGLIFVSARTHKKKTSSSATHWWWNEYLRPYKLTRESHTTLV